MDYERALVWKREREVRGRIRRPGDKGRDAGRDRQTEGRGKR